MSDHPIEDAITQRLTEDNITKVRNDLILYLSDLTRKEDEWMENAEQRLVEKHA